MTPTKDIPESDRTITIEVEMEEEIEEEEEEEEDAETNEEVTFCVSDNSGDWDDMGGMSASEACDEIEDRVEFFRAKGIRTIIMDPHGVFRG